MLSTVTFFLVNYKIIKYLTCYSKQTKYFLGRFYVGYFVVLTFCYKNICLLAFTFINCRNINDVSYLYINGMKCYEYWQITNYVFLVLWVAPFPIAVGFGYNLLKEKHISMRMFLIYLTFPSFSILNIIWRLKKKSNSINFNQNIDTQLKAIFEEPYKEEFYWWEAWRLFERFIVSGVAVFFINPIKRLTYLTPIFVFFVFFHFRLNPYKRSMPVLNKLDIVSWICLFINLGTNGMRAVVYIYNVQYVGSIKYALKAAEIMEQIFSPLWYLIVSLIKAKLVKKFM